MALSSPRLLAQSAAAAAKRFPFVLLSGAVAAFGGIWMVGETVGPTGNPDPWIRLMAAASLGIPLFIWFELSGFRGRHPALDWLGRVLLAGVPFYFYLASAGWTEEGTGFRFFHLALILHLGVAAGSRLKRSESIALWHRNKRILLRFILGGVYAGVLFGGLAAALAALDNLFGVGIPDETYPRLFFVLAFLFHPWFVLAGIPETTEGLEDDDYPSFVRVFAQYVLVPLVCLYFLILTAYLVRVLVLSDWPSGWIGYLTSALAIAGILSILLVHPERRRPGREWIGKYTRWFWIAILPQCGMLFAAIWQRIDQYGITESRYLMGVGAFWLAGSAIYALVRRPDGLRWLPIGLGAVALLTYAGPWSAYGVSVRSQTARVESIVSNHGGMEGGRFSRIAQTVPLRDREQIEDVFRHLVVRHGTGAVDRWFDGGVRSLLGEGEEIGDRGRGAERFAGLALGRLGLGPADDIGTLPPDIRISAAAWTDALGVGAGVYVPPATIPSSPTTIPTPDAAALGSPTASVVALVADADLLRGSYALPEGVVSGETVDVDGSGPQTRIAFEPVRVGEFVLVWDGVRFAGSYEHVLVAAREAAAGRSDSNDITFPPTTMTVELVPAGSELADAADAPAQRVLIFVSLLDFSGGVLETAAGLVLLLETAE